jgi:TRAP-type C4-dicarboxylate transport system substrate-binding protein
VLQLADSDAVDQPDTPTLRYFAEQVAKLSHGELRVQITFEAAGDKVPDVEVRTARMVRAGRFALGWIGARSWDEVGVKSFQSLQAPFLVTSYRLLGRISSSPIATEMLTGLKTQDVIGLALVPDLLRHPVGVDRPLVGLADFAGARVRVQPSRATSALMKALRAIPVEVSNSAVGAAVAHRQIDGEELALGNAPDGSTVTANVTLFGKTITLFARRRSFERLSDRQQGVLRSAAQQTLRHAVADPPSESALARRFCHDNGRIVLASAKDLAQLARAAQPVYAQLNRDAQTKSFIAQIRRLKATMAPDPPLIVPAGCSHRASPASVTRAKPRPTSIVNGTYHVLFTKADALAFGDPANTPENMKGLPSVETRILNDGRWLFGPGNRGTYTIRGNRITLFALTYGSVESFTFSLDSAGMLRLRPVLPMDRGDRWVVAGEPWRRVGPARPIR